MKSLFGSALLLSAIPLAGCASDRHALVLDPVGPPASLPQTAGPKGWLVVFSAHDPHAHFNSLPYTVFYTDYKIFSSDGRLLQSVQNNPNPSVPGPTRVALPAGDYRVVARANGYGMVTVPVVIAAHQTTTVHLEGGDAGSRDATLAHADQVRLPDGEIVGWRAAPKNDSSPAPLVAGSKDQKPPIPAGLHQ